MEMIDISVDNSILNNLEDNSNSSQSLIGSEERDLNHTNDYNCVEKSVVERRQCWLCLGQEELDQPLDQSLSTSDSQSSNESQWLSPCRCRGTAKWIHNECLQLWIDEKQKLDTSVAVKCSQCNTQYVLVFPQNGKLVDLIVWYESVINNVSTYAMVLCVAGALYMSAFTYGAITCHQIIGAEKTAELIENSNLSFALIGLPSIPFVLFAGKLINWENMVLRLWRRHYNKIPFLTFLTGSPAEGLVRQNMERHLLGLDNAVQIQRNNGVINHIEINVSGTSICRAFCGALLLPTFAKFVGQCFYDSIESDLNKTLLGGLTFIAIKGGLKIYLRQQQFIRQSKRKILNFSDFDGLLEHNSTES